jgi:hypothetical protein
LRTITSTIERARSVASRTYWPLSSAHHINADLLEEAFYELKADAAPGVDRLTWKDYEANLETFCENVRAKQ